MNKDKKKKESFRDRTLKRIIAPTIDRLLYACFYYYKNNTDSTILYDDYCKDIKSLLENGISDEV